MFLRTFIFKALCHEFSVQFKPTDTVLPRRLKSTGKTIEELFNEKVQEYKNKSSEGKLFEPTEEVLKELHDEYSRLRKLYGVENESEFEKFPKLNFKTPEIDPLMETKVEDGS